MTCFDVYVNDVHVCTAGIREFGAISAILTWVRRDPKKKPQDLPDKLWNRDEVLTFDVAGSSADDHSVRQRLEWISQHLHVGDRIRIDIVDADNCDQPRIKESAE